LTPDLSQTIVGDVSDKRLQLIEAVCDEDQALVHFPALDRQQAHHGMPVQGVATEAENRFGWVGNDTASAQQKSRLIQSP
jgi:hypothetical protein